MTTNLYPGQCPLCGRDYPANALPYHLAITHSLYLDLAMEPGFFRDHVLPYWAELLPFADRDPHES